MKQISLTIILTIFLIACGQNTVIEKNTVAKPSPSVSNSSNATASPNVSATPKTIPQNVSATPKAVPSPSIATKSTTNSTNNDPMNPTPKYFTSKGVVTKINKELGSIELDHEEIAGLMPKMIMEFFLKEPSKLDKLKLGDKVEFVLEDKGGSEVITEIKKIEK